MSLDTALEAHSQFAECCQPGVRSLHHPAMTPEAVIALDAPAGDAVLNATALEMVAAAMEVVALVGMQSFGPAPWPARQTPDSGQVVDELFEDDRVVPVGSRDAKHQRDARSVGHDVAFAAELATVGRVGARVRAPRGLATLAPSMLARLNRGGLRLAARPAASGAVGATPPRPAIRAAGASTSCRCQNPVPGAGPPRRCLCAARRGCR